MADNGKRYEKVEFLGEGQFATVYKAKDTEQANRIVAVKKIKLGTRQEAADGINRTALREIKLLQELHHVNVIGLLDVFGQKSNVSLVFDFMDTDLEIIIKDSQIILTPSNIKSYLIQTLKGLEYLHAHWILHRIGDFGLAKFFGSPNRVFTNQVVTRWYRSPELLFGAKNYSTGIDMWATGCILAELLLRVPFLPGDSDLDQLSCIFQALGTPNSESWPEMSSLADFVVFKTLPGTPLKDIFTAASDDLIEVLSSMLTMNPLSRCTATEALKMPYFSNKPAPTPGHLLPKPTNNKDIVIETEIKIGAKRKLMAAESGSLAKKLQF